MASSFEISEAPEMGPFACFKMKAPRRYFVDILIETIIFIDNPIIVSLVLIPTAEVSLTVRIRPATRKLCLAAGAVSTDLQTF